MHHIVYVIVQPASFVLIYRREFICFPKIRNKILLHLLFFETRPVLCISLVI